MIKKRFVENEQGLVARVTFTLPRCVWADTIHLVGDINEWDRGSHPFSKDEEGNWEITVDLAVGRAYQLRYLVDGNEWINESHADAYVHNPYGSDNFVVITDPQFERYYDGKDGMNSQPSH